MSSPRSVMTGLVLGALLGTGLLVGFSSGPPAGLTGAPGEGTCIICHGSFPLNSGSADFTISAPVALPSAPSPLPVTVGFGNSNTPRHGFELTLRDGTDSFTGSLSTNSNTTSPSQAYVSHNLSGVTQLSWNTTWTAPASLPAGPLTLYAAGNEANGNFAPSGDFIYTTSRKVFQAELGSATDQWPVGTSHNLDIVAPTVPNNLYFLAAAFDPTPTSLGFPMEAQININDPLVIPSLFNLPQIFSNFVGTTDSNGTATGTVNVPNLASLSGITIHFAYITMDLSGSVVTEVSNRFSATLQ